MKFCLSRHQCHSGFNEKAKNVKNNNKKNPKKTKKQRKQMAKNMN